MVEIFGQIGILFPNIVFQFVTFLLFVYLMYRFLYHPLSRTMQERRERIRASLDEAARLRHETHAERQQLEESIRGQREEAGERHEEVLRRVRILEEEETQAARDDAHRIRAEAQREAAALKDRVLEEAQTEIADLVIRATGKVLERSIDDAEHRRLVEEVLAEVNGRSA